MHPSGLDVFASAMTAVQHAFVVTFNCLHEAGVVSQLQAIHSFEKELRQIAGHQAFAVSALMLRGIAEGIRMEEQGGDFQPSADGFLQLVRDTPPTDESER